MKFTTKAVTAVELVLPAAADWQAIRDLLRAEHLVGFQCVVATDRATIRAVVGKETKRRLKKLLAKQKAMA